MLKIIATTMIMTVFALADGPVLQSGQVKSYDADGIVVTDGTVKDDGYYQAGIARDYNLSGNNVVVDNVTGLQWQDNESIMHIWSDAVSYCSSLSLEGEGWRLPSIEELETLVDNGRNYPYPSTTEDIFQHILSSGYWSATTLAYDSQGAWSVYFGDGYTTNAYTKSHSQYVRCVRGESLESPSLSRSDDIVTDSTTGLQWQDEYVVKIRKRTWASAIDYCEIALSLGGHNDWRLPNEKELLSIADRSRNHPAIDKTVFFYTEWENYWSSTTDADNALNAWIVYFRYGTAYTFAKNNEHYVRCVRGGKFGDLTCPEGQYEAQDERACIPGTPDPGWEGPYPDLPYSGNFPQGDTNEEGSRTEDPGWQDPYPSAIECPPGKVVAQGTEECTVDVPISVNPLPADITIDNAALQKVIASTFDNTPYYPAIDIQGVIDAGGLTVSVPYTVVNASVILPAYSTSVTLNTSVTQDSESGIVATFAWEEQNALPVGSGTFTATITIDDSAGNVDGIYNAKQLDIEDDGTGLVAAFFTYATDDAGGAGTLTLKIYPGIPDRMFGLPDNTDDDTTHNFLYVPVNNPKTGKIWLSNNLGANYANVNSPVFNLTQQATASDDHNAYGSLFQWGRKADGHELISWANGSEGIGVNGTTTANSDNPSDALFIIEASNPWDWRATHDDTLWENEASANNVCPAGYRVPTGGELDSERKSWIMNYSRGAISSPLKLPMPGCRTYSTGNVGGEGIEGNYWGSTVSGSNAEYLDFDDSNAYISVHGRAYGSPVRCIKD